MRKVLWILLPILLLLIFLPEILSSSIGKPFFNRAFSKQFNATTSIEKIQLSWLGPQHFDHISLSSPKMVGQIGHLQSSAPLWQLKRIGNDFSLSDAHFTFPSEGNASIQNIAAELHDSHLFAKGNVTPTGQFTIMGKIFTPNDFDISYELEQIPTAALDQLLAEQSWISPLLGKSVDAKGSLVLHHDQGSFTIDLQSPHLTTSLRASLDSNWMFLTEPFLGSLELTSSLASTWLTNVNPLFLTGMQSKTPLTLRIDPEGFRFPWRNFDLKDLQINYAILDMGQIQCEVGRTLSSLIALFKNFRKSDRAEVWFSPLEFSVHEGIVKTKRMDALIANAIHICNWGTIDFIDQKLNMILGICADTLDHSFGIKGLPVNYVLKMGLEGTPKKPQLDSATAAAKITALIAAGQLPKIGGKGGKIIGGAINLMTQSQENQDDVPPPKRPFPWER